MNPRTLLAAVALAAGVVPATGWGQQARPEARQALAAIAPLTAAQAELAYLSPAVRAQVEQRATGGNIVRGVMETMLLNAVSQLFAAQRWSPSIS